MNSETNPDCTKLLQKDVDNLKKNFLEAEKNASKAEKNKQVENERLYTYQNISRNKEHFKKAAGLAADQESFLNLFEFVDPGEDCKNIKFDDSSQKLSEAQFPLSSSSVGLLRSGRKPKVAATEHLFL